MKTYSILNHKGQNLFELQVSIPEPIQILLCKDRHTKQNYIMFRTITENSLTAPKLMFPVAFDRYCGIEFEEKR